LKPRFGINNLFGWKSDMGPRMSKDAELRRELMIMLFGRRW
jgi:hypothetical protein